MLISTQVSGEVNTVCGNVGKEVMLQKSQDEAHFDKCEKKKNVQSAILLLRRQHFNKLTF